jgi:amidase
MPIQLPTLERLAELAARLGLDLSTEDVAVYQRLIAGALPSFDRLDELDEPKPPVRYARVAGYRPRPEENPLNAWYWRCSIDGAPNGPLAGKTVALKDNVCVAGVPMMIGASWLEGFVPEIDATVVTRLLDAGARVTGKAVCEHLCVSDSSHTSDTGPVLNPHDVSRSAGGSSSGSAALVVAGECDISIGTDQAGSIRIPAAHCGAYGLKPTYGLVPYTGIVSLDRTLDHSGPIARTVRDLAVTLQAIGGPDGYDARQVGVQVDDYTARLEEGVEGLRVGVLEEGFGWPGAEPEVEETVRACASQLREVGAEVESISVPMHRDSPYVWRGIAIEGNVANVLHGNTQAPGAKDWYDTATIDAFRRAKERWAGRLAATEVFTALLGQYLYEDYGGHYYAKARNLATPLARSYDDALSRYDVLVMPTTPTRAPLLPGPRPSIEEDLRLAHAVNAAMCGFDVTGHPAISIPVGPVDGLPVGLMAISSLFGEATLLRFARACEQSIAAPVGVAAAAG